jgi:hypothetical protein
MNKSFISKNKLLLICLFLSLNLSNFPAQGQEKQRLTLPVKQFRLENGLQVILSEDYSLPVVSVAVAYNVGSINEQPGKTGLAYLLGELDVSGFTKCRTDAAHQLYPQDRRKPERHHHPRQNHFPANGSFSPAFPSTLARI